MKTKEEILALAQEFAESMSAHDQSEIDTEEANRLFLINTEARAALSAAIAELVAERDALNEQINGWKEDQKENLDNQVDLVKENTVLRLERDSARLIADFWERQDAKKP